MINVIQVWKDKNYTGHGIRLRINDDGVAYNHEEFKDRFDFDGSCDNARFLPTGSEGSYGADHGTNVASIAAASGNNGVCGVGISPNVILSACDAFNVTLRRSIFQEKINDHDISQNSFGLPGCLQLGTEARRKRQRRKRRRKLQQGANCPFREANAFSVGPCEVCDFTTDPPTRGQLCDETIIFHCQRHFEIDKGCIEFLDLLVEGGECEYNSLSVDDAAGLTAGITQGRNGKGIIYVVAVGNDLSAGSDANFEGLVNTRLTISVGAVGKDGLHASYSTPGASLFISAPGGDQESLTNIVTANPAGGCRDAGIGTSFACPVVSGVIALMLEANNDLTWRDVQGILALTSQTVTKDPNDDSLVTNAAGFNHSNLYGFGIVDAYEAVTAAESWVNFPEESIVVGESGKVNVPIIDKSSTSPSSSPAISTVTISPSAGQQGDFFTETVAILLDIRHFSRGDLDIILTSPGGTSSILSPGKRPETTQLDVDERWKLTTVRSWGESPFGTWTLNVTDLSEGDFAACVDHLWDLNVSGIILDCAFFERKEYCKDGSVDVVTLSLDGNNFLLDLEDEDGQLTFEEACCRCGGGRSREDGDFVDMVVQWRLLVYGHTTDTPVDTTTSVGPSAHPTVTASPSQTPTPTSLTSNPPSLGNITNSSSPSFESSPAPSIIPRVSQTPSQGPTTQPTNNTPTPQPSPLPEADQPSRIPPIVEAPNSGNAGLNYFESMVVVCGVTSLAIVSQTILF